MDFVVKGIHISEFSEEKRFLESISRFNLDPAQIWGDAEKNILITYLENNRSEEGRQPFLPPTNRGNPASRPLFIISVNI